MRKLLLFIMPLLMYGDGLRELIDYSTKQNDLVISKEFTKQSKSQALESKKSAYFPTLDVGAFYKRDDEPTPLQPGDIYSGFAKVSFDIYDGGKKSSNVNQAKNEFKSSSYESEATKKSIALQITGDFFNIKSLESSLESREEAQKSLKAQLERIIKFYEVKVATKNDVDRLQAAYDTNIYDMESLKFQILSLKKSLELKVGKSVSVLENSSFTKEDMNEYDTLDSTKSLMAKEESIRDSSNAIDSMYYPNIKIEDTYSLYAYDREDPADTSIYARPLDNQNTLMLTLNLRLFDYGQIGKSKEAILLGSQALNAQVSYQNKEQKIQFELAKSRIYATKLKIKSANSALISATSAFDTVEKKYDAGIVDYVIYLDALTSKTSAKALYKSSLNDLELAYAMYYFYGGKNIEEFIK